MVLKYQICRDFKILSIIEIGIPRGGHSILARGLKFVVVTPEVKCNGKNHRSNGN